MQLARWCSILRLLINLIIRFPLVRGPESLTSLGRKTRDTKEEEQVDNSGEGEGGGAKFGEWQIDGRLSKLKSQHPKSSARSFDSSEYSSEDGDESD